jgi:hypothetical protein
MKRNITRTYHPFVFAVFGVGCLVHLDGAHCCGWFGIGGELVVENGDCVRDYY